MGTENPWIAAAGSRSTPVEGEVEDRRGSSRVVTEAPREADRHEESDDAFEDVLTPGPVTDDDDDPEVAGKPSLFGFNRKVTKAVDDVPVTGPTAPQAAVALPEHTLPVQTLEAAPVSLVGAHGGAGVSSLASLADEWQDAGTSWNTSAGATVLVARTHSGGLLALRDALTQWAAGGVPGVTLLGVILVADAPGKMPTPLRDLEKVVCGGAPRVWRVGFHDSWRVGDPPRERRTRAVKKMVKQITSLAAETSAATHKEEN